MRDHYYLGRDWRAAILGNYDEVFAWVSRLAKCQNGFFCQDVRPDCVSCVLRVSRQAFWGSAWRHINTELVRIHPACLVHIELSCFFRLQQFLFQISQHIFRQDAVPHDCICGVIGTPVNDAPRSGVSDPRDAHQLCLACCVEDFQ